jgi:hypothetical protein
VLSLGRIAAICVELQVFEFRHLVRAELLLFFHSSPFDCLLHTAIGEREESVCNGILSLSSRNHLTPLLPFKFILSFALFQPSSTMAFRMLSTSIKATRYINTRPFTTAAAAASTAANNNHNHYNFVSRSTSSSSTHHHRRFSLAASTQSASFSSTTSIANSTISPAAAPAVAAPFTYPNTNKDVKTLPPRVRFAPSPTGSLHVGGARTALFNWLIAGT